MVSRNESERPTFIDYGQMGGALRREDSPYGQELFVSRNKKILHKPTPNVLDDIISIGIASHSITPTNEQLKTNLLAYVVGAAFHGLDENSEFEMEDPKSRTSYELFGETMTYRRFKDSLRQKVKEEEKGLLYRKILPRVIKRIGSINKGNFFIFEGDSLGVNVENGSGKATENSLLRILNTSKHPIHLIGIHTSPDYRFSNIFYKYFGKNRIDGFVSPSTYRLLKEWDSFVLPCMRAGERTALFRTPNNDYALSFYCKPDIHQYDIYPFQVDICTGRLANGKSNTDSIERADEVADAVMSMLSDIERIHITADDPIGRMIGKNRVLVNSLADAYASIFENMYHDIDNMKLNVLNDLYESEVKP